MRHLIMVRFNSGVYSRSDPRVKLDPDAWTRHRISLFRQYTVPSLLHQTNTNFELLLFVDAQTPGALVTDILAAANGLKVHIQYCTATDIHFGQLGQLTCLRGTAWPERVITTRLDSDDALGVTLVEHIQARGLSHNGIIDFGRGVRYQHGAAVGYFSRANYATPFLSLAQPVTANVDTVSTCYRYSHNAMKRQFNLLSLEEPNPAWLIVVHGQNLLNTLLRRDRDQLSRTEFGAHFGLVGADFNPGP